MKRSVLYVPAVLSVIIPSFTLAASFRGLDIPANYSSRATALSPDGSVVMGEIWSSGMPSETFRWTAAGGFSRQADIPGWGGYAWPYAMSYDGSVVVGYDNNPATAPGHAFKWTPEGGRVYLDDPAQISHSEAFAVSWDGAAIVGYRCRAGQSTPEAVLWRDGDAQPLGPGTGQNSFATSISSTGMVVGATSEWPGPSRPFRWTSQSGPQFMDFPQDVYFPSGPGVSADGSTIVGNWARQGGIGEVFVCNEDGAFGLGDLPGGSSGSYGGSTSANGRIVVGTSYTGILSPAPDLTIDTTTAFIWEAEHGMRSLPDVLRTEYGLDLQGWELWEATAISADGMTIVGNGISPDGYWRTWIAEVPEPASVLYLVFGLAFTSPFRRTRRLTGPVQQGQADTVTRADQSRRPLADSWRLIARKLTPTGFELPSESAQNMQNLTPRDADYDARSVESGLPAGSDQDLRTVVAAWPELPPAARESILSIIRQAARQ